MAIDKGVREDMKRSTVIIAVLALIVIAAGIYALSGGGASNTPSPSPSPVSETSPTASPETSTTPSPNASETSGGTTTDVTSAGFSTQPITVKSGQSLTFVNKSTTLIQVDSDPHPQHTDNPELNVGQIAPGSSKSVTPTRKGTFEIHDHLNSAHRGTVIVE
jgi:hypothetical protein